MGYRDICMLDDSKPRPAGLLVLVWSCLALWAGLLCFQVGAAEEAASEARLSFADLSWLENGSWQGEGLGGKIEESWSAAEGRTLMGLFRLSSGSVTQVIEFMLITESDEGVIFRFKHFGADYGTRESGAPLTFDLARVAEGEAFFESSRQENPKSLHYRLQADGSLEVTVQGSRNGVPNTFTVTMAPVEN